jgi:ParB-like chromosome segregation protein Spo0J
MGALIWSKTDLGHNQFTPLQMAIENHVMDGTQSMSELQIVYRSVAELIPYAANSRTHSDAQVAQIAASIKEFGWASPILIDGDNTIIAGHGRLLAARKLGMEEVPAIIVDHLSKAQQRALVIADNQLALNAGWDMDMLKAEIEDLNLDGFDLELLGFDDKFLDALNASEFEETRIAEEQDVEAVFEIAVSCANEDEQEKVYQILTEQGLKCRVLTM